MNTIFQLSYQSPSNKNRYFEFFHEHQSTIMKIKQILNKMKTPEKTIKRMFTLRRDIPSILFEDSD